MPLPKLVLRFPPERTIFCVSTFETVKALPPYLLRSGMSDEVLNLSVLATPLADFLLPGAPGDGRCWRQR